MRSSSSCADLRLVRFFIRFSISHNEHDIRYFSAIASRWSQHFLSNIAKCSGGVSDAHRVIEWWDGWLDWGDREMCVQVKSFFGVDVSRKSNKTDSCVAAVDIQSAHKCRQKRLRLFEVLAIHARRLIQYKDYVNITFRPVIYLSCT